jgi:hypothetical protein
MGPPSIPSIVRAVNVAPAGVPAGVDRHRLTASPGTVRNARPRRRRATTDSLDSARLAAGSGVLRQATGPRIKHGQDRVARRDRHGGAAPGAPSLRTGQPHPDDSAETDIRTATPRRSGRCGDRLRGNGTGRGSVESGAVPDRQHAGRRAGSHAAAARVELRHETRHLGLARRMSRRPTPLAGQARGTRVGILWATLGSQCLRRARDHGWSVFPNRPSLRATASPWRTTDLLAVTERTVRPTAVGNRWWFTDPAHGEAPPASVVLPDGDERAGRVRHARMPAARRAALCDSAAESTDAVMMGWMDGPAFPDGCADGGSAARPGRRRATDGDRGHRA